MSQIFEKITKKSNILFVNPWIHDFAAYDFWAKPIGLLYMAAILRKFGLSVSYIDCLNRFHPNEKIANPNARHIRHGKGPYRKTTLPNPKGLENINRTFCRYGIKKDWLTNDLKSIARPDLIFVTSFMTYWYPGVIDTIKIIKSIYKDVPVILGGIYATLYTDHAKKYSGADQVVSGDGFKFILNLIKDKTKVFQFDSENIDSFAYPAYDLQNIISYVPILTSRGCPFNCSYCASKYLYPKHYFRNPDKVVDEIKYWYQKHKVSDFVFYDDALLVNAKNHANIIFQKIIDEKLNLRFHTPNAVHIRNISQMTSKLMYKMGFTNLRIGLESTNFDEKRKSFDNKVNQKELIQCIKNLYEAGFTGDQIGAYILFGLPDQSIKDIEQSINAVTQLGIKPIIAYYTPIPYTNMWEKAVKYSRYDLKSDPIFCNNAILPCQKKDFSWEEILHLKKLCKTK